MAKEFLVGSTGFVGTNLREQHEFTRCFHSTDIEEAYGQEPDLLVYAGVRAEMFLANRDPAADYALIEQAQENIRRIAPRELVLISTVAVYPVPRGADEDTQPSPAEQTAYGANRHALERWAEENVPVCRVIRLPAIYGSGLKKNFLYDYIHVIPAMLTEMKFAELAEKEPLLREFYSRQDNGFWKCRALSGEEEAQLKAAFRSLGFTALAFTDSRSVYQFYSLRRLWADMERMRRADIRRLNLVPPPLSTAEVYRALCGETFSNELNKPPFDYDLRTKHAGLFGREDGYIMDREEELGEILAFVRECGGNVQ